MGTIYQSIEILSKEKGIDPQIVLDAVKDAMLAAARKHYRTNEELVAEFDQRTGAIQVFAVMKAVEEVADPDKEMTLDQARKLDPAAEVGSEIRIPKPTDLLGRISAQTAKQVILQKVREAERETVYAEYSHRVGELVNCTVKRLEGPDVVVDLGKTEARLPKKEQSKLESFSVGERTRCVIRSVEKAGKNAGLIVSRAAPELVMRLFEQEVPEIYDNTVVIKACAREAGERTKIAVWSRDRDVDCVGACVGMKGMRVQSIIRELRGEKIDIIEFSDDPVVFATNALSPAKISRVTVLDPAENHLEVIVDDSQLSLAIGKKGQNVRLCAKLMGWKIDIKSEEEKRQEVESAMAALVVPGAPVSVLVDHGLTDNLVEKLLETGVATVERLGSMTPEELEQIPGIGPEMVEKIQVAVNSYYAQFEEALAETPAGPAPAEEAAPEPAAQVPGEAPAGEQAVEEAEEPPAGEAAGEAVAGAEVAEAAPVVEETPEPAAPRSQQASLAGQPAVRPVVPPRPDLVARLAQARAMPGQPQPLRRPAAAPVPGQPIYRGPIRPGQPLMARPGLAAGARPLRGRALHPTAAARLEPPIAVTDQARRAQDKRGPRVAERERQLEREEKILRPAARRAAAEALPAFGKQITVSEGITVKELSEKLGVKASVAIKKLVERKIFATINQTLDVKLAEEIARELGATVSTVSYEEEAVHEVEQAEVERDLVRRAPVVTIMGHVDHGKTSLLDAIRLTNVAEKEAGGITQHIGAYHVEKNGRKIVFIDTPGHEAFTRMRARGAKVTDIVILVVAADDGVMPQTIEAIDHAKAAGVPIVVAINKIDKPDAQPERIKQQLADRGLLPEEWGGDTVMVAVSAKTKQNLDLLLEMILLVADLQELKANPNRPGVGSVLEAQLDRGRGPVATVLVRNGTLNVGDYFICGSVFGRVRAMFDDWGRPVKAAEPATPVEVLGLESLPEVGDTLQAVTDTAKAKQIVVYRESKAQELAMARSSRVTLDQLHEQIKSGEVKELNIILKTDVGGTAEVLSDTLQKLATEKVRVRVLHAGVGAITEWDVLLASASNAIVVGFSVRPERNAAAVAEQEKVDIRLHTIIYELIDEIKRAMTGMLEPVFKETYRGRAEVREVFHISKVGNVAGCVVLDGLLARDSDVRVLRDNVVVYTGKVGSLRRFKNDASEVKSGMECGLAIENFSDVKPGDIVEAFVTERVAVEAFA